MTAAHTPTPWWVQGDWIAAGQEGYESYVAGPLGDTSEEASANTAFIVRAVNNHHDLLEALQEIAEHTDPDAPEENYRADDREGCLDTVFEIARAALAKARGEA